MHDARPCMSAHTRKASAAVGQKRVGQRPGRHAGGRMHDHPGGLVYDDQVTVLMQYLQRNFLRYQTTISDLWNADDQNIPLGYPCPGFGQDLPCPRNRPCRNQPRQPGPTQRRFLWHIAGKRLIETVGRVLHDRDPQDR